MVNHELTIATLPYIKLNSIDSHVSSRCKGLNGVFCFLSRCPSMRVDGWTEQHFSILIVLFIKWDTTDKKNLLLGHVTDRNLSYRC
jgi:hypothetical protein